MIDELENEAQIAYWHILNHGKYLDLRIAIQDERQKKMFHRGAIRLSVGLCHMFASRVTVVWGLCPWA